MSTGTYISIISLSLYRLNAPTKRHRMVEWIQNKKDLYICCLQETHFRPRDAHGLRVRGWKKIFQAIGNQKKARVSILTSDKTDFKIKNIIRDKKVHYTMTKESIQEDITTASIYAPQHIRQRLTDIKEEIKNSRGF